MGVSHAEYTVAYLNWQMAENDPDSTFAVKLDARGRWYGVREAYRKETKETGKSDEQ